MLSILMWISFWGIALSSRAQGYAARSRL